MDGKQPDGAAGSERLRDLPQVPGADATFELGIVGCGRMAGAMLSRWLQTGALRANEVIAANATAAEATDVRARYGVYATERASEPIERARIVLLGIKPQQIDLVLPSLAAHIQAGQVWISMLAGVPLRRLRELLGPKPVLIRIMPNQPARLGCGVTGVATEAGLSEATRQATRDLLADLGDVIELDEERLDAFAAIAGSGPAYVYLFLEALTQAAEALGFEADTAHAMALQTLRGAAALASETGSVPASLRRDVTSPGGTTEAALQVFESRDWRGTVEAATAAAVARAADLAGGKD